MKRRGLILAAATAAVAAGAGGALWRGRTGDQGAPQLWTLSLDTPAGGQLALASLRGRHLLINFWATWCPPCVREMPALDRFHRDFSPRGWQVLGIAADSLAPVRDFLARTPVGFPIALAGFGGIELSRTLGNVSGGLPFTVLIGRSGDIVHRHMGETRYEQLEGWAAGLS
jgi:thiol-disulfide isomerase/thioredoxin